MRRISGGAVWSNRPRTDLARAPVEKSAGATLRAEISSRYQSVDIIRKTLSSRKESLIGDLSLKKGNSNSGEFVLFCIFVRKLISV